MRAWRRAVGGLKVGKNAAMLLFLQAVAQKCVFEHVFVSPSATQAGTLLMRLVGRRRQRGRRQMSSSSAHPTIVSSSATQGGLAPLGRLGGRWRGPAVAARW